MYSGVQEKMVVTLVWVELSLDEGFLTTDIKSCISYKYPDILKIEICLVSGDTLNIKNIARTSCCMAVDHMCNLIANS